MEKIGVVLSAKEAFEKLEKVGEGTYGKVYRNKPKPKKTSNPKI
jgi:cyclin-dependent kinase